jgi:uncharacterized protein YbjT (DUF2867 family)
MTQKPIALRLNWPCLIVDRLPDGNVHVVVDNSAFTPGEWGIVIADLVKHVANAFAADGMDPIAAARDVERFLRAELERPSSTVRRLTAEEEANVKLSDAEASAIFAEEEET